MTSKTFAIPTRDYINKLAFSWLAGRWWLFVIPLAAVMVWALFDIRAVYVALVIVFLLYPMSLTLVWFNYALSPQSLRAISPKQVTVSADGLKIDFLPKHEDCKPLPSTVISWSEIHSVELSSGGMTLILGSRLDDRLYLPSDAFSSQAWDLMTDHLADRLPSPDGL